MDYASTDPQSAKTPSHRLVLQNTFDDLPRLSTWVNELAQQFKIATEYSFRLELVVTEAVTNIIKYAYLDGKVHEITLDLQFLPSEIRIQIKDDGKPFDLRQHPDAILPTKLEEAKEGGLGIHLIRNFADQLDYQRQDNLNTLIISVHLPSRDHT